MWAHNFDAVHAFLDKKDVINQNVAVLAILVWFFYFGRVVPGVFNNYTWTFKNASLEQQGGGFSLQDGRAERGVHVSVEFVSFARRVAVDRFV